MSNHYHLRLETPEANLVVGMKWFQGTYSIRFNQRRKLRGHVFQGRYKAVLVDPEERSYLPTVSDYIHLNPVRVGLLKRGAELAEYRWSSYPWYVGNPRKRPVWLEVEKVLGEFGLEDRAADRRHYAESSQRQALEAARPGPETEEKHGQLRRGWCLGGAKFRERVLGMIDQAADRQQKRRPGDAVLWREHGTAEAERLVARAMEALKLEPGELGQLRKSDECKILIGALLRKVTTSSNGWIAQRSSMGDPTRVSRYCSRQRWMGDAKFRRKLDRLEKMSICMD
jgi:hypothetical protein